MTTYISWPVYIDAEFRKRYLEAVGEAIQQDPHEAIDGLSFCVATSRAKEYELMTLQLLLPEVLFGGSMEAVKFTPSANEG